MKNYSTENVSIDKLHGKVQFKLTNDYMFRAVFQTNPTALKGLLCALLHLSEKELISTEILNPIEIGKEIGDKEFRLDIKLKLNNNRIINLEMQINNIGNWGERSLSYLCRMFDNLNRGDDYSKVKPVMHIGILDFSLFKDDPEFYSTYMMMNQKTRKIFSDKFVLKTLDITHTDLATEEDKTYNIDTWAKVFKSSTWDELKKLSQGNVFFEEVTKSMHLFSEDFEVREIMIRRQEHDAIMRKLHKDLAETRESLTEKDKSLAEKDKSLAEKDRTLAEKDKTLAEKDKSLAEKDKKIAELKAKLEKFEGTET